jgi:MHS family proline/betaine transporter-like MFS transporter
MTFFASLKREQKEAVGLLQIGTFLEYFDLMLYVHMAVLLNELFFPKTDPHTASLITAFAFCSTYVLRPFGAFLFGYIGDHVGRKATVILTTLMMAISCIIMANLPTYAQIGITAAWLVTLCRIVQGLASMGEIMGAEIYLTEMTKPPERYPVVALIPCASRLGTVAALGVALLVTSYGFNWRSAFWVGAAIAVVGSVARTRLRETPDFVDRKRRMKRAIEDYEENGSSRPAALLTQSTPEWTQKVHWKTIVAFFMIYAGPPVCLYFSYIHCGTLLKNMGLTADAIISQNFIVAIIEFLAMLLTAFLSYRIHPLKIVKLRALLFLFFLCLLPPLLTNAHTPIFILLIQVVSVCLTLSPVPAVGALMIHFPVFKRFTYASFMYAFSRALVHVVTAFGLVYLTEFIGHWGVLCVMLPIAVGLLWGVSHFEKLEKATGALQQHPSVAMAT